MLLKLRARSQVEDENTSTRTFDSLMDKKGTRSKSNYYRPPYSTLMKTSRQNSNFLCISLNMKVDLVP